MDTVTPLLELRASTKRFVRKPDAAAKIARLFGASVPSRTVHAVDDVSLAVRPGEVVGLVGESGCGKSTLGRMAAGLQALSEGERWWQGENAELRRRRLSASEHRRDMLGVQMIFQDPYASLNPRMRVRQIIGEAPVAHGLVDAKDQEAHVAALMQKVGLDAGFMRRFPHQFSGGQRARIGIARALAVRPRLLICDEAVAALDVSIQAQVINLFMALREELALTYLFISHDLGVVRHISDRVVVMYLGRVVESAGADALFGQPLHPYTEGLLAEAPKLEVRKKAFVAIQGEIPSPLNPPRGCHFHPRCPRAMRRCAEEVPALARVAGDRWVACHLVERMGGA
ncbi:ABC transporter ATP-binding protein [Variovorax paradoxus]|uniref:Oligopeptide transport ATP-binding protein OppF n=1 Tax=Variovorax paradoxus TaxID=34073 RepID=A0A0H2LTI6_VARPD|nr:oligopeptide/dipeptide ABC transporter ATP-binding protein [Variovorax paradoxus]KLN53499.1 oligopeptide transport ATP-binding protein OppF [Variovorax paradoxus]